MNRNIYQIVLTGGTCGGKSTFLSCLKKDIEREDFKVITQREVATELLTSGIQFNELSTFLAQKIIMEKALLNEKIALEVATEYREKGYNVLILYDRGLLDNRAYCSDKVWINILECLNLANENLYKRYNAVFDLVSLACTDENAFRELVETNGARHNKSVSWAIAEEKALQKSWRDHPNFQIIINDDDGFFGKGKRLLSAINTIIAPTETAFSTNK